MTKCRGSRAIGCKEADKQAEVKMLLSVSRSCFLFIWVVFLTFCHYFLPHDLASSELNQHKSMRWLPDAFDGIWILLISSNLNLNIHSGLKWLQNETTFSHEFATAVVLLNVAWPLKYKTALHAARLFTRLSLLVCWVESKLQQPSMNIHGDNAHLYFIKVGSLKQTIQLSVLVL